VSTISNQKGTLYTDGRLDPHKLNKIRAKALAEHYTVLTKSMSKHILGKIYSRHNMKKHAKILLGINTVSKS